VEDQVGNHDSPDIAIQFTLSSIQAGLKRQPPSLQEYDGCNAKANPVRIRRRVTNRADLV